MERVFDLGYGVNWLRFFKAKVTITGDLTVFSYVFDFQSILCYVDTPFFNYLIIFYLLFIIFR